MANRYYKSDITGEIRNVAGTGDAGFQPGTFTEVGDITGSPLKPLSTEVGMIDTGSAVKQVNNQNSYLNQTYPIQPIQPKVDTFGVPIDKSIEGKTTPITTKPAEVSKATYTNADGQTFIYSQEELNDPIIQQQIKDGGMVLSNKDAGINIYGDSNQTDPLQAAVDAGNKQIEDLTNDMLSWNVDTDPDFQAQAQSIRAQYEKLRQSMEKTNYSRQQAYASAGARQGTTQYAGDITRGIVGEEITQGSERLNEISRQESDAISAARTAYKTGKWNDFNNITNALKDIRDQKQTALKDYNQSLIDANKQLQDQAKFEFDVYKWTEEQKAKAGETMTVSPGSSIYSKSGEYLGTAPEKPTNPMDYLKEVDGNLLQYNPDTGGFSVVYSSADSGGKPLTMSEQISLMEKGYLVVNGKPVINADGSYMKTVNTAELEQAKANVSKIDSILNHPGLNESVGPNTFARGFFNWNEWYNSNAKNFVADTESLISQQSLDSLIAAKARGATFGALSDTEMAILTSAATSLGKLRIYKDNDSTKEVIGYATTEKNFKEKLNLIKEKADNIIKYAEIERNGGQATPLMKLTEYGNTHPDSRDFIENGKDKSTGIPYTEQEKMEILGISFNKVGGDTNTAVKVASIPVGQKAGQCGRFVNQYTGLGLGDSFQSKMAKMNPNIVNPSAGMVFVMPYKNTGHTGIILAVNSDGTATVKDSNWSLDEKVKVHKIPINQMTGFTYA